MGSGVVLAIVWRQGVGGWKMSRGGGRDWPGSDVEQREATKERSKEREEREKREHTLSITFQVAIKKQP